MKKLCALLALLLVNFGSIAESQVVGIRVGVPRPASGPGGGGGGGGPGSSAYPSFQRNFAPVATRGDNAPADATSAAGAYNKNPRQLFTPNRVCANGDILAFYQGMDTNSHDYGVHSILQIRSTDKGRTWGAPTVVYRLPGFTARTKYLFTGVCVIDSASGRCHFWFTQNENAGGTDTPAAKSDVKAMYTYSTDNGLTWEPPVDLSTSVKKVSGTNAAPWDASTEDWGWCVFGPGGGCQIVNGPNAGRIVIPANHRYATSNTGSAYAHFIYSDDNGATWGILGGPLESANAGFGETQVVEYGSAGELFAMHRINATTFRGTSRSTAGSGTTWSNAVQNDGVATGLDGVTLTTNLIGASTCGGLCRMGDGTLVASFPGDSGIRAQGQVWISTNNGITWQNSRTLYRGPFGYSSLMAVDASSILAAYEYSTNYTGPATDSPATAWYQYLGVSRFPLSWITDTATLSGSRWNFNERTSGAFPTLGNPIKDHGDQGAHAMGEAGGSWTTTGAATNGVARAVTLAEKQTSGVLGNTTDMGTGSFTLEIADFVVTAGDGTARTIVDNRNGTGVGWTLGLTTGNKLQWSYSDTGGTNSGSVTSTASVLANSPPIDIRAERNATTHQASLYIDGTLAVAAAAETPGNTGAIVAPYDCIIGAKNNNGADATPCACTFSAVAVTRGIKTTGFVDGSDTKQTLYALQGYTPSIPATAPSTISGLALWMFATGDGGASSFGDRYGGTDPRAMPLVAGTGISSYRDRASDLLGRITVSTNRGHWFDSDATVGPHYRLSFQSSTGYLSVTDAEHAKSGTRALDFMHRTGVFTVTFACKFNSGTAGCVFDMTTNLISKNGLYIQRTTGTTWDIRLSQSGANLSNNTYTKTTTNGIWYNVALVGNGPGNPLNLYVNQAASAPAIGTAANSGNMAALGTLANSDIGLTWGAKQSGVTDADLRIKNFCVWNKALNTGTELPQVFQYNVSH